MVLAKERGKRNVAADILNSHGAEFVGFTADGRGSRWELKVPMLLGLAPATDNQGTKKQ